MSKINAALERLNTSMARLEAAYDAADAAVEPPEAGDDLHQEIQRLRSRRDEDAKLRAEAAGAVREALQDLRGAVTRGAQDDAHDGGQAKGQANA